jgi:hypothetical protein
VRDGPVLVPGNAFGPSGSIDGDRERQHDDDSPGSTTDAKKSILRKTAALKKNSVRVEKNILSTVSGHALFGFLSRMSPGMYSGTDRNVRIDET